MFVKSNMSKEVKYHKSKGVVVLKPGTVTFVDDNLVTAKELKDCYGDRINIMSREIVEKYIVETAPAVEEPLEEIKEPELTEGNEDEETKGDEEGSITGGAAPVEFTGNEDIDDFLNGKTDKVPEGTKEITEEEALKLKEKAYKGEEVKEEDLISNTGNEEIDAFLNGETDKVPEGAKEITEEEALKLQEGVKREEIKAKESQPVKKPVGKKPGKKVDGKKEANK